MVSPDENSHRGCIGPLTRLRSAVATSWNSCLFDVGATRIHPQASLPWIPASDGICYGVEINLEPTARDRHVYSSVGLAPIGMRPIMLGLRDYMGAARRHGDLGNDPIRTSPHVPLRRSVVWERHGYHKS
jgi:hypothetical protein